jgi:uncharacterized protein YecT (DUF1311 family)
MQKRRGLVMRTIVLPVRTVFLALTACGRSDDTKTVAANDCSSQQTEEAFKDRLFQQISAATGAGLPEMSKAKSGTVVRIEDAVVDQRNDELIKTIYSARLVVELPPGGALTPRGTDQPSAEVRYSVQESASGTGRVYTLFGAEALPGELSLEPLPARPITSTRLVPTSQKTEVQRGNFHPAFRCSASNTSVEKMICASPELSALDRQGSAAYDAVLRVANVPGGRSAVQGFQRQFLRDRNACRTTVCLAEAYRSHGDDLQGIQDRAQE